MNIESHKQEYETSTREALVESALILFANNGFTATSIGLIAEEACVTKGLAHRHFKTKKEVFIACYRQQLVLVSQAIAAAKTDDDLWQYALNQCHAFLVFVTFQRDATLSLQGVISVMGWLEWRKLDTEYTMGHITKTIEGLKHQGAIKPYSTEALVDMIYGLLVNAALHLSAQAQTTSDSVSFELCGEWSKNIIHSIGKFLGAEQSTAVSELEQYEWQSSSRKINVPIGNKQQNRDAIIEDCQVWLAENYDTASPVNAVIQISGLSGRSFIRRFKNVTGMTPIDYVLNLRIEEAKQILETGSEPIEAVAEIVGYQDASFFSRKFQTKVGLTPAQYRKKVSRVRDFRATPSLINRWPSLYSH